MKKTNKMKRVEERKNARRMKNVRKLRIAEKMRRAIKRQKTESDGYKLTGKWPLNPLLIKLIQTLII